MQFKIDRFPKISVVTPSLNQGDFLRETLQSVVDQRYRELELIVIDGGSTDGSLNVIRMFEEHLSYWESCEDRGQSHAINKGFAKATGEVLCWLNSDDVLLPGSLNAVAHHFGTHPDDRWLTAPSLRFGEGLHMLDGVPKVPTDKVRWLLRCPIAQPSTFWRRDLYEQFGGLDESYHFALDYEYWVRLVFAGEKPRLIKRPLSAFRLHDASKTVSQSERFLEETARMRKKYADSLGPAERARLERSLRAMATEDGLTEAVWLLEEGRQDEARKQVFRLLSQKPGMAFTRIGAGSLSRVIMNRRRYS
ncbi:MAG: glycosyltransferase [Armatimonadetes bacterium]|nr:glycosyltransferase [Armatimonadota bacterium]